MSAERKGTDYVSLPAVVLASEADYAEDECCVVMPCCGFMFGAGHVDDGVEPPQYTCPLCAARFR